eukprot:scaffold8372_cov88-Skeletonema_dohrnii-CCMP3373.AAC.7
MRFLFVIATVASLGLGIVHGKSSKSLSLPLHPNGNEMSPKEYCPHLGSDFPPEPGCFPGGGANPSGYPKCCSKQQRGIGSCPNNKRPKCENKMASAPSYCADLRPNFDCYVDGWPQCCVTDGTMCPPDVPDCDIDIHSSNAPSQTPTLELELSLNPTPNSLPGSCILKPPYDAHHDSDPLCGSHSYCSIPKGVCKNNAVLVGKCVKMSQTHCSEDYKPICGCDGQTYGNLCHAEVAGVNIRKNGACKK